MNATRTFGSLLLTTLIMAPTLAAQPPEDGGHAERHRPGPQRLLKQTDTDGDRAVTLDEWRTFVLAADTNSDGILDEDERAALRPADAPERRGNRGRRAPEALVDEPLTTERLIELHSRFDRNEDGTINAEDRPGRRARGRRGPARLRGARGAGPALARAADTMGNGDGTVTRDEWQAFLRASDTDGSGTLSRAEVVTATADERPRAARPEPTLDELEARFDDLDANDDGVLSDEEVIRRRV